MIKFFNFVLKNQVVVGVITLALLGWSVFSLDQLNISAVPDVTNKQVVVNTKTGSFSTEQIEKIVTYPIEVEMSAIPGVEEVRSLSKYGLSQVTIVFDDTFDIYLARQLVGEKLQSVRSVLPPEVSPEIGPLTTGLGEIYMWVLEISADSELRSQSRKAQLQYLRRIQDYQIRPKLKKVRGVAEVDTNGGYNTEVHINYDPKKVLKYGLNLKEIIGAIKTVGSSFGGSYIKKQGEQITIRSLVPLKALKDIEEIPLKILPSGQQVRVKDVCSVLYESAPRVGGATFEGSETVLGTILMRVGANSSRVIDNVKTEMARLNLPTDVELKVVYDRQYLVSQTIRTVVKNLAEGALLVIVVLMLILGNFRASIIVALAIPFSMLIALKGMHLFAIPANLMSLGAIDFGLLVDASVVLVENYIRRLNETSGSLSLKERTQILIQSASEVAKPVIFGLLIIMLVYIPILALEGVEGKMFEPMAITVLMALGASLVVALFLTPILALITLRRGSQGHESRLFQLIIAGYEPSLRWTLRHRAVVLSVSLLMLLSSAFVFTRLGADFVPQLDEGDLVIGLIRDSKQDIDTSIDEQRKAEKIITQFPEVKHVFSRIGTPESATDPMSPNFADTFVILEKNKSKWPSVNAGRRRSKTELYEAIAERLEKEMAPQDISATQPIEMRFNEILEGSRADVTLRFLGPDLTELVNYAQQGENLLGTIAGVQSVEFDALTGLTKSKVLDVEVDPNKAVSYGLAPHEINEYVQTSLAGKEVGTFFLNGIQTPFIFHLDEKLRNDITELKELPIPSDSSGSGVALKELADFTLTEKVTTIARRWAERYSAVSIYLSGRTFLALSKRRKRKSTKRSSLRKATPLSGVDSLRNLARARARLLVLVPLTLLTIFFLIFFMTHSLLQAAVIFMSIPLGAAGGVFFLALREINFSVSAAVGFIALSGIVVLNSLVLVNSINQNIESGLESMKAITDGALSRLRPVTMTALVAGLGFLPMAFNTGMGAEVQRPLATVVIGGLLTSTVLTMIVIPTLLTFIVSKKSDENNSM
jgi:cobalt-zinc-cadmium resistance protein CzcA